MDFPRYNKFKLVGGSSTKKHTSNSKHTNQLYHIMFRSSTYIFNLLVLLIPVFPQIITIENNDPASNDLVLFKVQSELLAGVIALQYEVVEGDKFKLVKYQLPDGEPIRDTLNTPNGRFTVGEQVDSNLDGKFVAFVNIDGEEKNPTVSQRLKRKTVTRESVVELI